MASGLTNSWLKPLAEPVALLERPCANGRRHALISRAEVTFCSRHPVIAPVRRGPVRAPTSHAQPPANSAGQLFVSKTSTSHRAALLRLIRTSAVIRGTLRAWAKATY